MVKLVVEDLNKLVNEDVEVYYCAFSIAEESVPNGFEKNILETEVKKRHIN